MAIFVALLVLSGVFLPVQSQAPKPCCTPQEFTTGLCKYRIRIIAVSIVKACKKIVQDQYFTGYMHSHISHITVILLLMFHVFGNNYIFYQEESISDLTGLPAQLHFALDCFFVFVFSFF